MSRTQKRASRAPIVVGAVGLGLAAAAVANHFLAKRAERRNPPQGALITVDGVRLHYLDRGGGDPIVLIHGNSAMAVDFEISGLFDRLAATRRVIAFDRPGFGYSERPRDRLWTARAQADLIAAALRQLGVGAATVVGHSWGSLVAVRMGLDHPDRVGRLVLMSGYYRPTPRLDGPLMGGPAVPVIGDLMRFTLSPLLGLLMTPLVFRQLFAPAPVPDNFRKRFPTGMALRPSQIRASAADTVFMVPDAAGAWPRVGELSMPVLVVSGDGDRIVSFEDQSLSLSERLPESTLQAFEGAGHMVHHLRPAEIVAAILSDGAGAKKAAEGGRQTRPRPIQLSSGMSGTPQPSPAIG
jgi:pimeloyl-ACP methyl ester carboxylesterase